ncbi:MAG: hypothetical protein WDM91_08260 [Rhizomicrobium sp.]
MADESRQLATLLLGNAMGFHLAAKRIASCGVERDFPWPPFFANTGYALELSLKAYIIHSGGTDKKCRAIGHDLHRAIDAACALDLTHPSQAVMALVDRIGPYHRDHNFRYMAPIDVEVLPDVQETLTVTNQHLLSIADQLPELLPE